MPFDPKQFYRKMESLLAEIDATEDTDQLLETVLDKLVQTFGEELLIHNGRLYIGEGDGFVLTKTITENEDNLIGLKIPLSYPPMQLLLQNRMYIYDQSTPGLDSQLEERLGGVFSVAILVAGPDHQYILAFGLREGWNREILEFSLNTIRNLINHRFVEVRFQSKLMEAKEIQQSLLPPPQYSFYGFDIYASSIPAEEVGGDFYDFIPITGQNLGIAIGDSSGHGLTAALQVRDVVTGLRMGIEKDFKVTSVIERLNRVIHKSSLSTRFISLFFGELDENGDLFYINAGHVPPILFDTGTVSTLTVGGLPLGPTPESNYRRGYVHLNPGSILLCYTDGIEERSNAKKVQFGVERITRLVQEKMDLSSELLVQSVMDEADIFGQKAEWDDDATVIAIKRTGQEVCSEGIL
ncbi:MAG: PP2C family protein-serine/threonine phosphatase [Gemmatimonadota bacterium]|nr:MAG: PP2C family protein-serine/threonine phosphatase [Gemmatimonadota bacterium]